MSWHFSRALVAAYSADTSSAGAPSAPSSGSHTHALYCAPDRMKVFSRLSRFGTTCGPLTDDLGAGVLTWCLEASLAKTSAQPAKALESTESEAECGRTWRESFARWDHASSLWRTPQCSLLAGLDVFSETWPRWGMMRGGECSVLSMPAHLTSGTASGLWPTPIKSDCQVRRPSVGWKGESDLPSVVWRMNGGDQNPSKFPVKLNPAWTEWLMGWPLGWTNLKPLGTDKFQAWRRLHGGF